MGVDGRGMVDIRQEMIMATVVRRDALARHQEAPAADGEDHREAAERISEATEED